MLKRGLDIAGSDVETAKELDEPGSVLGETQAAGIGCCVAAKTAACSRSLRPFSDSTVGAEQPARSPTKRPTRSTTSARSSAAGTDRGARRTTEPHAASLSLVSTPLRSCAPLRPGVFPTNPTCPGGRLMGAGPLTLRVEGQLEAVRMITKRKLLRRVRKGSANFHGLPQPLRFGP
jgi:hypothetical protein